MKMNLSILLSRERKGAYKYHNNLDKRNLAITIVDDNTPNTSLKCCALNSSLKSLRSNPGKDHFHIGVRFRAST